MSWYLAGILVVLAGAAVWLARRRRPVMLEALFTVATDDTGITAAAPDGQRRTLAWPELTKVTIRTTDEGPLVADVFWQFHAGDAHPVFEIPGGATGEADLLHALGARLPGFRHEEVIRAMGSTSDARFVVWEAQPPDAAGSGGVPAP